MSNKTNEVRDALRRIIDKEGASCLRDVGRFRSLWLDYIPQSKEAKLILSAIQEGVGSTLVAAKDKDEAGQRQSIKRCEQQMVEAFITEEGSRYAVREIASALNIDVDRIMPEAAAASAPQPQGGSRSVSNQMQESVPSSGRQEIYPGQQRQQNKEFPSGSTFKETPVKKSKFPWILLILLLFIIGAVAGIFLTRSNDTVPVVPPVDVQDEEENVQAPVVLPMGDTEKPAEDDAGIPPVVEPEPETLAYEIDTVASNVETVSSMVMDNENNLYYIVGNTVYSTKADSVVGFSTDNSDVGILVHDPYSDTVYLLTNVNKIDPTITDITNCWKGVFGVEIEPILNKENCPRFDEFTFHMPEVSNHTTQLGVLKNGALLVSVSVYGFSNEGDSDTYMINIDQKTATPVLPRYMYRNSPIFVVEDNIVEITNGDTPYATIIAFSGETSTVNIDRKLPYSPMYARDGIIYFYDNSYGVCGFGLDGKITALIPKEAIAVKDYQSLTTNIGAFAVGTDGHVAFYDTALKCIRMIQPTGTAAE